MNGYRTEPLTTAAIDSLGIGSVIKDKDGDRLTRTQDGWTYMPGEALPGTTRPTRYPPYTIVKEVEAK